MLIINKIILSINKTDYKYIFIKLFFITILSIKNKYRVCLCTVGKLENNYIKDFVIHYKKYGIDKIFLYDNNDINGERFEEVIYEYIKNQFVKLFNYRGKVNPQLKIYNHCYRVHYKYYDWLIFYDIDEFIYLKNINNIKIFLSQKIFNNCKSIYLNWNKHTDNNLLYYENKSIIERFPETIKNKKYCLGKTIIRGNINTFRTHSIHILDKRVPKCNGFGKNITLKHLFCQKPDLKYYYIDHYEYKSTEEFIKKINKGDCTFGYGIRIKLLRIKRYFKFNKITLEKIKLIENKTGLNLSNYKKKIK